MDNKCTAIFSENCVFLNNIGYVSDKHRALSDACSYFYRIENKGRRVVQYTLCVTCVDCRTVWTIDIF